jgi:hypothetical protein
MANVLARGTAVSAAEKLFEQGHFSVENLAMNLNCSLRELNAAIGSVDQLVLEVNSRTLDRLLASVSGDAFQAGSPEEQVQRLCRVFLEFCQKHRIFVEILFQHPFDEAFERPAWYLEQVAACFKPMENALAKLAPGKSPEACQLAARAVWSQVLGIFYLMYNQRLGPVGIQSQENLVKFSIETFLRGWTLQLSESK